MNTTHVSDLTVDELKALIRAAVRDVLHEELIPKAERSLQWSILDIPVFEVDPRHPALSMLRREDM